MREISIVKDSPEGKAQIRAIKHFEKEVNRALKELTRSWRRSRNVRIKIVIPESIGSVHVEATMEEMGTKIRSCKIPKKV